MLALEICDEGNAASDVYLACRRGADGTFQVASRMGRARPARGQYGNQSASAVILSGDKSSPCGDRCTRSRARPRSREAMRMLCLNPDLVVRVLCTPLHCLASKAVKAPRS